MICMSSSGDTAKTRKMRCGPAWALPRRMIARSLPRSAPRRRVAKRGLGALDPRGFGEVLDNDAAENSQKSVAPLEDKVLEYGLQLEDHSPEVLDPRLDQITAQSLYLEPPLEIQMGRILFEEALRCDEATGKTLDEASRKTYIKAASWYLLGTKIAEDRSRMLASVEGFAKSKTECAVPPRRG